MMKRSFYIEILCKIYRATTPTHHRTLLVASRGGRIGNRDYMFKRPTMRSTKKVSSRKRSRKRFPLYRIGIPHPEHIPQSACVPPAFTRDV